MNEPTYMLPMPSEVRLSGRTKADILYQRSVHFNKVRNHPRLGNKFAHMATSDDALLKHIMGLKVRVNFITSKDFKKGK